MVLSVDTVLHHLALQRSSLKTQSKMGFLGPFSGHIKCLYKRLQVNVLIVKHFLNKENLPVVDFSVHVYWSTLFAQLKNQLFIQLTENHRHGTKINIYHNYQKLSVTDYK